MSKSSFFIPVNEPRIDQIDIEEVSKTLSKNWVSSEAPIVKDFEKKFAKLFNRKFGISVCNGTVALDLAIKSLEIEKDSEVILPNFTIISCASAIIRNNLQPRFVDANINDWNIDADLIESEITSRTKAIMIVHIYGMPSNVKKILKIAKKYNLKVIEDFAEAIGSEFENKPCGMFGDISITSLYSNKHITTGEGGMILTNNKKLQEKCIYYRNLCFLPDKRFFHIDLGWNYRMTALQAALGTNQLKRIDKLISYKIRIGDMYRTYLNDLNAILLQPPKNKYSTNINWVFGIVLKKSNKVKKKVLQNKLFKMGIETRPFFYPLNKQPALIKNEQVNFDRDKDYPVSKYIYDNGFYLPTGLGTSLTTIETVAKKTRDLLLKYE